MNTRHIVVKTLLNSDEFIRLERNCKEADIPQSRLLRDLANGWAISNEANSKRGGAGRTRPERVPFMPMFPPRERVYRTHMRL